MTDNSVRMTSLYVRAREIAGRARADGRSLSADEDRELDEIVAEFNRLDAEHWSGREDVRARLAAELGVRV